VAQTKGSFRVTYELIDQLKELGLYENSTIIITGDHGYSLDFEANEYAPLSEPVVTACFVKLAAASEEPLEVSMAAVDDDNMRATIIQAAGGDSSAYGPTYAEAHDPNVPRRYITSSTDDKFLEVFDVIGDANDWSSWHLLKQLSR
jgi:arylsulfatase A-like enzyme